MFDFECVIFFKSFVAKSRPYHEDEVTEVAKAECVIEIT